jgi:hypothetical protein
MQAIVEGQVMELKKSVTALKFVKIVMNSIFVNESLPSFMNLPFVRFFFCFPDSFALLFKFASNLFLHLGFSK